MTLAVTPIYAGLLALLFLLLSARVILFRRRERVSLGDKGDPDLLTRIRAQGNASEYAPLGILLLLLAELQGTPPLALHALGLSLLSGRALHAYGFIAEPMNFPCRIFGMALTLTMIAVTSLWLLLQTLL